MGYETPSIESFYVTTLCQRLGEFKNMWSDNVWSLCQRTALFN